MSDGTRSIGTPGRLLTVSGNEACFLRRTLNVRFSMDYVSSNPESGPVGCMPDESESDP